MINFIRRYWAIILIAIYVISPIDFLPGPIDDLILLVLGTLKEIQERDLVDNIKKKSKGNSETGEKEDPVEGEVIEAKKVEKKKED